MKTVLFYTSNQEPEPFASKIREQLLESIGDRYPLVSVSQKPLPGFGKNICVGEVGPSYPNLIRQLQIGVSAIFTEFVIMAEADSIYPPCYFDFTPDTKDYVFRYSNVWIIRKKNEAKRKRYYEGGQIVGRDFLLHHVNKALVGHPMWTAPYVQSVGLIFSRGMWKFWEDDPPIVQFKTGYGMRSVTGVMKDISPVPVLPYWGSVRELKNKFSWCWPK